jgi:hypothetical protein
MIPKSTPIEFSLGNKEIGLTSQTKLRKYLSALSLITVTEDGSEVNTASS